MPLLNSGKQPRATVRGHSGGFARLTALSATDCRTHPVRPNHTPEDLIVFYLPDRDEWQRRCALMLHAGFTEVPPFNPYWRQHGRTFEDHDGYRVVLQQSEWPYGDRARFSDQLGGPTPAYGLRGSVTSNAGGRHALRGR